MTARSKVTLQEAAKIKRHVQSVVLAEFGNAPVSSSIADALLSAGLIDTDAALRAVAEAELDADLARLVKPPRSGTA